jgi:hypothetical protein
MAGGRNTDRIAKLWFWNKLQALELLFDHLGLAHSPADDERPKVTVFLLPPGARVATS